MLEISFLLTTFIIYIYFYQWKKKEQWEKKKPWTIFTQNNTVILSTPPPARMYLNRNPHASSQILKAKYVCESDRSKTP